MTATMTAPWYFKVARAAADRGLRGSSFAMRAMARFGMLDKPATIPVAPGIELVAPPKINFWSARQIAEYEQPLFDAMGPIVQRMNAPVLIDCGADIGIFSLKLFAAASNISRIYAFEPSKDAALWLQKSLQGLPIIATATQAAVADFRGSGELESPANDATQYARYLVRRPKGSILVLQVDDIARDARGKSVVLKIDVEGGELAVLRGARETIAAAPEIVVVLEAHPAVAQRTSVDPIQMLQYLAEIRGFSFQIEDGRSVDVRRPFFEQFPGTQVYNVIATSAAAAPKED